MFAASTGPITDKELQLMSIYQDSILSDLFSGPKKAEDTNPELHQFIQKANVLHNNNYSYSEVNYTNSYSKVTIICPKHGRFLKTPNKHLSGKGCPYCSKDKVAFTTSEFISKSLEVHGSKYIYDQVKYVHMMHKVTIVCPGHGPYQQNPRDHLKGSGCSECHRLTRTMTEEEYVIKAKSVHNNSYDYSMTKFKNARNKVTVGCRYHGPFEINGYSHLRGVGCQKCKLSAKYEVDKIKFIDQARIKHQNKFDYSLVDYQGLNTSVTVICNTHGEFRITPWCHLLRAGGCAKCYGNNPKTTQQFILDAKKRHGDKYDYSLSEYVNAKTPLTIICRVHGEFQQGPNSHLNGSDCPKCHINQSKMEKKWLDSLKIPVRYRQEKIKTKSGKVYTVDAYDPYTNTIYEFNGDFWHGNPRVHDPEHMNHISNKTFKQLYEETLRKEQDLKHSGYNVVSIWESEWKTIQQKEK
jgi:hypothetical protein